MAGKSLIAGNSSLRNNTLAQAQESSPRTILSIDTSQPLLGLALLQGTEFLVVLEDDSGLPHSQRLFPLLQKILRDQGLGMAEVDLLVINTGPGSFTGLRVGLAAVNGLAATLGKPLLGMDAFAALAYEVGQHEVPIVAILKASRGEVFLGKRVLSGGGISTIGQDQVLSLPQAVEVVNDEIGEAEALFIGNGATALWPQLGTSEKRQLAVAPVSLVCPLAKWASTQSTVTLMSQQEAYYLRPSAAESKRAQ
jgi:tRNA threonylcarbamoyladenosine biosynthesis protein TsaB